MAIWARVALQKSATLENQEFLLELNSLVRKFDGIENLTVAINRLAEAELLLYREDVAEHLTVARQVALRLRLSILPRVKVEATTLLGKASSISIDYLNRAILECINEIGRKDRSLSEISESLLAIGERILKEGNAETKIIGQQIKDFATDI